MVGITTSIGSAAYGKTAQLGNNTMDRQREAVQERKDAEKLAAQSAAERREMRTERPEPANETRPPESASRSERTEGEHTRRGSLVDIAV